MKLGILSSRHTKICQFVIVSTAVFIKKNIGICQYVHKICISFIVSTKICLSLSLCSRILSIFVFVSTKIFRCLSSYPQKYISVIVSTEISQCHRIHKNLSSFVIVSTKIRQCHRVHKNLSIFVIMSTKIRQCHRVHKNLSIFAIVSTKIRQCHRIHKNLSIFVIVSTKIRQCHRVHKNLSIFVIVSTKIRQCHRIHKSLSMFIIVWTKTCHWTVTLTHLNHIISLFFTFNLHSLSRYPSSFSDHVFLCFSFFSLSTYLFILIITNYISAIMLA